MAPPEIVHVYVMPLMAVTDAVRPVAPDVTGLAATMVGVVGAAGGAFTVMLRARAALCVPAAFTSTTLSVSVPGLPAVYVMRFVVPTISPAVPFGLVRVPFVIVQRYVMPARAATVAVSPVWPASTGLVAVMAAGRVGAAIDCTVAVPGLLAAPAAFRSTQVMVIVPTAPAVYVMRLIPPLVTPAVPPVVIVPPERVQVYVMPVRAGTVAVRPVAPVVTGLTVVMVGVSGPPTTVTLLLPVALTPARVTTQPRDNVPAEPALKVTAFVPAPAVMVPFVIVQAYVAPAWLGTEACSPAAPAETLAGAVIVAFGAASTMAHAVAAMAAFALSAAVTAQTPPLLNVGVAADFD
ncbi:MAG TPA: hypothetical protein VM759_06715, partial [Longimicrobium sp.]|nr:hypothetical protein [Longimicrobium sp.]